MSENENRERSVAESAEHVASIEGERGFVRQPRPLDAVSRHRCARDRFRRTHGGWRAGLVLRA